MHQPSAHSLAPPMCVCVSVLGQGSKLYFVLVSFAMLVGLL